MKVTIILNTDGSGLWSTTAKTVVVTRLTCSVSDFGDGMLGELCVYFDTKSWDVHKLGLIYTDALFLSQLRNFLKSQGFAGTINYSEQGMQDEEYVSLDVDRQFCEEWMSKFPETEIVK